MNSSLEDKFLTAFERDKDRIFRICNAYTDDHEDAKDLFQEVVLNIWKSMPTFKEASIISTWIYRITLNICIRAKQLSDKTQQRTTRLDSIIYKNLSSGNQDTNNDYKALYQCINHLSDIDKSIILMHLEQLSYDNISEVLGISENHVAVKISRIKKKLLTCLNK